MLKAGSELLWACLTYNIMQWVRLVWRPPATASVILTRYAAGLQGPRKRPKIVN